MIKELLVFWCIAVPVVENGDDYHSVSNKITVACDRAIKDCENHYHDCEIKYCGHGENPSLIECNMDYFTDELENRDKNKEQE